MNRHYQSITIDHPNLPILSQADTSVPFGYLVNPTEKAGDSKGVSTVRIQDMYLPNFSIRVSEGEFDQEAVFVNTSAEGLDLLGTCLLLKGNMKSVVNKHHEGITSFNGSQNFKYDPNNIFLHTTPAHNPFHIVHISMRPEHLFQFLPENEWWSDELKKKVENKESIIGDRYTPITLLQERALQTIFNCPIDGQLGQLMIETSVVQIMLIQLHSIFQSKDVFPITVARRDIDVIQAVKEHLSKTFLDDHSLEKLAKQFGVNTNKLMSIFKKVFNKSIFEYISELKMDHARHLLEEQDYLVAEAARTLGYKNPNHFSAAFKKKFGISPSQVR